MPRSSSSGIWTAFSILATVFASMFILGAGDVYAKPQTEHKEAEACRQGDLKACLSHGERLQRSGEARNVRTAADLYKRACRGKLDAACVAYLELFEEFDSPYDDLGVRFDTEAGVMRFLTTECKAGVGGACYALAQRVADHSDMEAQHLQWMKSSCSAGYEPGCKQFRSLTKEAAEIAQIEQAAQARHRRDACVAPRNYLAEEEKRRELAEATFARAQEFLASANTPKFEAADIEADFAIALSCLRVSADLGAADAQFELGRGLYFGLLGVEADTSEGTRYLQLAADQGNAEARLELFHISEAIADAAKASAAEARRLSVRTTPQVINRFLDEVISIDSMSWVSSRYDPNSTRNGRFLGEFDGLVTVKAEYTFDRGKKGWVRAEVRDETVECVEFWDFPGTCRPIGASPSQAIMATFMSLFGAMISAPAPRSTQEDFDAFMAQKQIEADHRKYGQSP